MISIDDQSSYLALVLAVAILLGIVLLLLRKRRRYDTVLFIGCSNSGKTVLYTRLLHGKSAQTYTSMKENVGLYRTKKRQLQIVDIPGNERISKIIFDKYKTGARAIVVLVDSESIQRELRDVAELLYYVFVDPVVRSNCKQILIVCNKQDLNLAKGTTVVQMLLEKELTMLRSLKTKLLDNTNDEKNPKKSFLGNPDKNFEFKDLKSICISLVESTAFDPSDDDSSVQNAIDWLNTL